MQLDAFLWMFLPVFVAAGSALLSFYIMQARMEVAIAKERESLAEARAVINTHKVTLEERMKSTEEATRRKSLDEFMQDFRVEERSYVRESKSMFANKKSMIMQERLFFRNIPLSNWVEHEMLIEEGSDSQQLGKASSVFGGARGITDDNKGAINRMVEELASSGFANAQMERFLSSPTRH
ncbi:MAG: hypothetical protein ABI823_02350 [Bryobacteraceae bacterium]